MSTAVREPHALIESMADGKRQAQSVRNKSGSTHPYWSIASAAAKLRFVRDATDSRPQLVNRNYRAPT